MFNGLKISNQKLISKSLCNLAFAEKYKYEIQQKKNSGIFLKTISLIINSSYAAILTGFFTYPYDLALTRKITCSNIKEIIINSNAKANKNSNKKAFKDFFNYQNDKRPSNILRYYEGFWYSYLEGVINSSALILFYSLYKINSDNNSDSDCDREVKDNNNNFLKKFAYSSLAGISASIFSYPFNTITKFVQIRDIEVFGSFNIKKFLYSSNLKEKLNLYK